MAGPLRGVRVLEFAGIGPAPFCAMLLADMGAEVLRVDRAGAPPAPDHVLARGRRSIAVDLKQPSAVATCLAALEKVDVLIEGFRPGVMERLGLGPEPALARNPRLIYGRMTGWGQDGPLAQAAGHDINYIALTGALDAVGQAGGPPVPPLNLVGDFGGGALYLAFGVAAALVERERSGRGQVIDAAVVDGTASLMTLFWGMAGADPGALRRGETLLGGAAPFYGCYECADGRYVSVGPLEPPFYAALLAALDLDPEALPQSWTDRGAWPAVRAEIARAFRSRPAAAWIDRLEGTDACFAPVLSMHEAAEHPHMRARGVFQEAFGMVQPAPAPRFSRTPGAIASAPPRPGEGGLELLRSWGVDAD
jgi:alpha-methylacyl-CoA racemase